jgi:thiamine biosynthesis protein ThiS
MRLVINGEEKESDVQFLHELLPSCEGMAIAVNRVVIPRNKWLEVPLQEGDQIEIVIPYQGG